MMIDRVDSTNREGLSEFDVKWNYPEGPVSSGAFTAVLRVKNEARALPWTLPGVLDTVDEAVLVDNGSDDGTPEVAVEIAERMGQESKLRVLSYPFDISRCGTEHLETPPDSVHSLTYFYNWAFSHARTSYYLKWDGDMVLTEQGRRTFRNLAWQLENVDAVVQLIRHPLYVESPEVAYVDALTRNREAWAWPNKETFFFGKAPEWEIPVRPPSTPQMLPAGEWLCFEIKWLDEDEFAHWSHRDFMRTARQGRKQREWEVYNALNSGRVPEGMIRIEAGDADHVLEVASRIDPFPDEF